MNGFSGGMKTPKVAKPGASMKKPKGTGMKFGKQAMSKKMAMPKKGKLGGSALGGGY